MCGLFYLLRYDLFMKILLMMMILLTSCAHQQTISRPIVEAIEEVSISELKLNDVEARVDTGALASTIHANKMKFIDRDNKTYVQFEFCHEEACSKEKYEKEVLAFASVKSSNGKSSKRPIISLEVEIKGKKIKAHFTLYNRSKMTYPILIGRDLLSGIFYVNPDVEEKIEIP